MILEIEKLFQQLDNNICLINLYGAELEFLDETNANKIIKSLKQENYKGIFADSDSTCMFVDGKRHKFKGKAKPIKHYIDDPDTLALIYKETIPNKTEYFKMIKLRSISQDFLADCKNIFDEIERYKQEIQKFSTLINDCIISKYKCINTCYLCNFNIDNIVKEMHKNLQEKELEAFCINYTKCMSFMDYTFDKYKACIELIKKNI